MDILLRILVAILAVITTIVNNILNILPTKNSTFPPIRNRLLLKSLGEIVLELKQRKLTSTEIVRAYIERIKEVNPALNAVIEDRFDDALKEAEHADQLISKCNDDQLLALYSRHPLLGIPFTVKESCSVKDLSFVVGNIHRVNKKSERNGEVVELLRSAGCIPLLVSGNPELCLSFETNTKTHGRCNNPYDLRRSTAGSSGGEGALNGSGASLFGLGSDIAGSIRLPALFCGVYGHKPTGGLTSVVGHFPHSSIDAEFSNYLQLGPITRFARDLPILLQIMAGENAEKLKYLETIATKDIKIYYLYGFGGLNGLLHPQLSLEIKIAMMRAIRWFEKCGLTTQKMKIKKFHNSLEISVAALSSMKGIQSIVTQSIDDRPSALFLAKEFLCSTIGKSEYTKEALAMELLLTLSKILQSNRSDLWQTELNELKTELIEILGTDGVLVFPTFHMSAFFHNTSILNIGGVDTMMIFNVLGLPATSVPFGVDRHGCPIGMQIIAAPYQDKLCLQIAGELENAFGGWKPPVKHDLKT